jgi:hypothetical protein
MTKGTKPEEQYDKPTNHPRLQKVKEYATGFVTAVKDKGWNFLGRLSSRTSQQRDPETQSGQTTPKKGKGKPPDKRTAESSTDISETAARPEAQPRNENDELPNDNKGYPFDHEDKANERLKPSDKETAGSSSDISENKETAGSSSDISEKLLDQMHIR